MVGSWIRFTLLLLAADFVFTIGFAARRAEAAIACSTNALITAIENAVTAGGTQTIDLAVSCSYTLTSVNNGSGIDSNGLPLITNNVNLTINGNNATITRDSMAPAFRIFRIATGATLSLNFVTISNGRTSDGLNMSAGEPGGSGGGLFNSGTLHLTDTVIKDNRTGDGIGEGVGGGSGAGVHNVGTLTSLRTLFQNNVTGKQIPTYAGGVQGPGGGIYSNTSLLVTDSTFKQNQSGLGGGIENFGGGATVSGSTFVHNSADDGGGFSNYVAGAFTLTNSTLSSNDATDEGGGMWNDGVLTVTNCTVVGNTAASGGGVYQESGVTTFKSSIVAFNTPGGNCAVNAAPAAIVDGGYNIDDGTSCTFNVMNNSQPSTDPKLDMAGLQNNTGPTDTIGLQPTSPAIDKIPLTTNGCGTTVGTDQRGIMRPQNTTCDIGAFEVVAPMAPTQTPTSTPTSSPTPTDTPTLTPTPSPTQTPTRTPSQSPTQTPTITPTRSPSQSPSMTATYSPTGSPTQTPTPTPTMTPNDDDGDGVASAIENGAPNNGDANGDGTPDSEQSNVASLPDATHGSYETIVTDPACPLKNVAAVALDPPGYRLPFGALSFRLPGCATTKVTIFYHGVDSLSAPPFEYVKQGPNPPGAANNIVYTLSFGPPHNTMFGSAPLSFDSAVGTVMFTLTDGVVGDDTIAGDGIVDQGGPGVATTAPVPLLGPFGITIVTTVLGLLGVLEIRRQTRKPSSSCRF